MLVVGIAVKMAKRSCPFEEFEDVSEVSCTSQWSAAGAGAAASYMKKPLFHVAVLAPSAHQFLSNVSAHQFLSNVSALHTVVSPQVSRLSVLLSQSKVSAQHVVVSPQVSLFFCLSQKSPLSTLS